jgi:hypothetical protein
MGPAGATARGAALATRPLTPRPRADTRANEPPPRRMLLRDIGEPENGVFKINLQDVIASGLSHSRSFVNVHIQARWTLFLRLPGVKSSHKTGAKFFAIMYAAGQTSLMTRLQGGHRRSLAFGTPPPHRNRWDLSRHAGSRRASGRKTSASYTHLRGLAGRTPTRSVAGRRRGTPSRGTRRDPGNARQGQAPGIGWRPSAAGRHVDPSAARSPALGPRPGVRCRPFPRAGGEIRGLLTERRHSPKRITAGHALADHEHGKRPTP